MGKRSDEAVPALSKAELERLHDRAAEAAALLKALSNENRLLILCTLAGGELSVSELNERIAMSQSALSQQLAVLRREGLVQTRREAQTIYYSRSEEHTSELQSRENLVCRLLLEKKKYNARRIRPTCN